MVSFVVILCCLILPLLVKWDSSTNLDITSFNQTISENDKKFSNKTGAYNIRKRCISSQNDSPMINNNSLVLDYFDTQILIFYIAILSCSSFIQLYFYYKLFIMIIALIIFIIGFHVHKINGGLSILTNLEKIDGFMAEIIIKLIFYVIFLHIVNRRVSLNLINLNYII